jgi:hypothetical protein
MKHNLNIAWKASLTHTPPPICTFAPGSQTALIWRAERRCERLNRYIMPYFPQRKSFSACACKNGVASAKSGIGVYLRRQGFESVRRFDAADCCHIFADCKK